MDYVDGADAAQLLGDSHHDGMPPRMVIEIVSAIADALDYAHDHGLLHHFVNPGNILVSKSPSDIRRVTLAGFGVAHPLGDTNTLTRANLFIGTASYTAPEQLMEDTVDGRADQYALAGSAFHLLTGAPPFAHFNPAVTASKHLNDRPPRPSEVRPDLTDYDAIFARALSQDPVDRFRRCRDFAKALESTGGSRSHIRGAAIFRDAPDRQDTATTAMLAAPESDNAAPTKPAAHAAPDTARHDAPAAPDVLPDSPCHRSTLTPRPTSTMRSPLGERCADRGERRRTTKRRRRRLQHTAALAGVILVVVLACFFGVKALRSASQSDDTPTGVDTTSAESTTPPPATTAPPAMIAPPPMVRPRLRRPLHTQRRTPRVSGDDATDDHTLAGRDDPSADQLVDTADDRVADHHAAFDLTDDHRLRPSGAGHSACYRDALRSPDQARGSNLELGRSGQLCGHARRIRVGTPRRVTGGTRRSAIVSPP